MIVVRDSSPAEFLEHAGSLLYEKEAEYALPLGLVEALQTYLRPEITPLFLRVVERDLTTAVCVQTRPQNVMLSRVTGEQAAALAAYFRDHGIRVAGASGPPPGVQEFSARYSPAVARLRMRNRILWLTQLIPPRLAPGQLRVARLADLATARRFFEEFHLECIPDELPTAEKLEAMTRERIERETVFLWESGGRPVSSAHITRPTRRGISIGPVYTPASERGKGYASNLVAAVSQRMLDDGKEFCTLITDAENCSSNKVYESIGYEVIGTSEYFSYD